MCPQFARGTARQEKLKPFWMRIVQGLNFLQERRNLLDFIHSHMGDRWRQREDLALERRWVAFELAAQPGFLQIENTAPIGRQQSLEQGGLASLTCSKQEANLVPRERAL